MAVSSDPLRGGCDTVLHARHSSGPADVNVEAKAVEAAKEGLRSGGGAFGGAFRG